MICHLCDEREGRLFSDPLLAEHIVIRSEFVSDLDQLFLTEFLYACLVSGQTDVTGELRVVF